MDQIANTTADGMLAGAELGVSSEIDEAWRQQSTEATPVGEQRFQRTRWPQTPVRTETPARIGVSLVIPAMNEALNIGWVLRRLPDGIDEVILVDGNSVDDTVAVSRAVCPDIRVVGQDRRGKGAALRAGFAAARGDVIVMIDADRSMDPQEIKRFLALIEEGYDLVKGSRFMGDGGTTDMERVRQYGNAALRGFANTLYRTRFTDLCYGFMAFRREHLDALALRGDGFEIETEIVVRAVKSGLRVGEVASFEQPRGHGESNLNTWRDGTRVLREMLKHRFTPRMQDAVALPAPADLVVGAEIAPAMADVA